MSGYIDPSQVVKVRIFTEFTYEPDLTSDALQWTLDGIDGQGGYTESCWSFDTWDEAVAAVPSFIESLGCVNLLLVEHHGVTIDTVGSDNNGDRMAP